MMTTLSFMAGRDSIPYSVFRVVRELHMLPEQDGNGYSVDLLVESEDLPEHVDCWLRFHYVSQLKLEGFGGTQTRITGLHIKDISDRAWEGISIEVMDFENNQIHLFARSMEIVQPGAGKTP
jgi:hypothetical protein